MAGKGTKILSQSLSLSLSLPSPISEFTIPLVFSVRSVHRAPLSLFSLSELFDMYHWYQSTRF